MRQRVPAFQARQCNRWLPPKQPAAPLSGNREPTGSERAPCAERPVRIWISNAKSSPSISSATGYFRWRSPISPCSVVSRCYFSSWISTWAGSWVWLGSISSDLWRWRPVLCPPLHALATVPPPSRRWDGLGAVLEAISTSRFAAVCQISIRSVNSGLYFLPWIGFGFSSSSFF